MEAISTLEGRGEAPQRAEAQSRLIAAGWVFPVALASVLLAYYLGPLWATFGWVSLTWSGALLLAIHTARVTGRGRVLLGLLVGCVGLVWLDGFLTRSWWLAHVGLAL